MKTTIKLQNLIFKTFIFALLIVLSSCEKESVSDNYSAVDASAKASPAAVKGDLSIAEIVTNFKNDEENPQFTLLFAALEYAGITSLFAGTDQYTVFAPTDAAFAEFLDGRPLTDFTPEQVAAVLSYHVTDGRRFSNSVLPKKNTKEIETLLGPSIYIINDQGEIDTNDEDTARNAGILVGAGLFNISASNGVIHVIDAVLVPAE